MTNYTGQRHIELAVFLEKTGVLFNMYRKLLLKFYRSAVVSILLFAVVCWEGSIKKMDSGQLDKLVRQAGSVVSMFRGMLLMVKRKTYKILWPLSHTFQGLQGSGGLTS